MTPSTAAPTDARLYVVDAFTDVPFRGNPAGVVLTERPADDAWMQLVAAELRHSETAFVTPPGDGVTTQGDHVATQGDHVPTRSDGRAVGVWGLRWFTPTVEVDLCGHATLAAAHVLGGEAVFLTRGGRLTCTMRERGWIEMDFPADPPVAEEFTDELRRALGGVTIVAVARGITDILVQVSSPQEVRDVAPDLAAIASLPARGVIVTAQNSGTTHHPSTVHHPTTSHDLSAPPEAALVVSRCFYPAVGVPEDPVTGSAHCTLASWWCPRLGCESFLAEQLSPRGGFVRVAHRGDRVALSGQAVTLWSGTIVA